MSLYSFDEDAVSSIVNNLKEDIENYRTNIASLKQVINSIETSDAWVDKNVKTSFISTAESYIKKYEEMIRWMETLVNYLSSKSKSSSGLETAYS